MAKYVTRTSKYTEARITVYNNKENALVDKIIFVNGWYKDFNRNGDGYIACQECNTLTVNEIMVQVKEHTNKSEKRKMSMDKWLEYSESCDGTEEEENEEE